MGQIGRDIDPRLEVLLANPPFGIGRSPSPIASAGALEFLAYSMDSLAPGGCCAIIVPDGVLFRDEGPYRQARERLLTEFAVIGIVRLPTGVFHAAPDLHANILCFRRGPSPPSVIRYYQVPSGGHRRMRVLSREDLDGALAWIRDGKPDRRAWAVRVKDVMCGSWSLDVPWPGHDAERGASGASQLSLLPDDAVNAAGAHSCAPLGEWIEKRGAPADGRTVDRILGISKSGFVPFKGRPAPHTHGYRRVEVGDYAYNPTRVASGSIALCLDTSEECWVSPAYVVFRLTGGAPFDPVELLEFLRSPAGMAAAARHSHGSVHRRLRFKDLGQILIPLRSGGQT